jgi:hypothetical protein
MVHMGLCAAVDAAMDTQFHAPYSIQQLIGKLDSRSCVLHRS